MKNSPTRRRYSDFLKQIRGMADMPVPESAKLFMSGKLARAIEIAEVRDQLLPEGCSDLREFFEKKDPAFIAAWARFVKAIPTPEFNPYKQYVGAAWHVPTETEAKLSHTVELYLDEPDAKRNIVVVGNKGSGKTASQNLWLSEFNAGLEARNVFWVRCDAAKLFEVWTKIRVAEKLGEISPEIIDLVGISEYFDMQLVYVFAKYCLHEDRAFLRDILNGLKEDDIAFDMPAGYGEAAETERQSVHAFITGTVARELSAHERSRPKESYMLHLLEVGSKSRGRERRRWRACSRRLQEFMSGKGIAVMRLLDGVDNVHINDPESQRCYSQMVPLVREFIFSHPPAVRDINIACMRQRTLIDCASGPTLRNTLRHIDMKRIEHVAPKETDVVAQRCKYLLPAGKTQSSDDVAALFSKVNAVNYPWIQMVFHANVRSYLYNCASLVLHLRFRLQHGVLAVAEQILIQRTRNLFLNGRLFLDTISYWHAINNEQGVVVHNPFIGDRTVAAQGDISGWFGLARVRLLEALSQATSAVDNDVLLMHLSNAFKYPENVVKQCVDDARAFGWIDSVETAADSSFGLVISDLGKFVLNELVGNVDALYYFALDASMPHKMIAAGMFPSHRNVAGRTGYRSAAIASTISFLSAALVRDQIERSTFEYARANTVDNGLFVDSPSFLSKAHWRRVSAHILRIIDQFDAEDVREFDQYCKTYRSRFGLSDGSAQLLGD